jgi:glutamyl-tRNA synthetase
MREKVNFPGEIIRDGSYFFLEPKEYDQQALGKKWKPETPEFLRNLAQAYEHLGVLDAAAAEEVFKAQCTAAGQSTGQWMQLLRLAISGAAAGPPLYEMIALLGKDKAIQRLRAAAENMKP